MIREIISKTNNSEDKCKTAFLNICGKEDFMRFMLSIILDGADFLHTTGSTVWNDMKKELDCCFPVAVGDEEKSKLVLTFENTDGKKEGEVFNVNISGVNVDKNDEINILQTFIYFLIERREIPVDIVVSAITDVLEEFIPELKDDTCVDCSTNGTDTNRCVTCENAPKVNNNEDSCNKGTCADCECRCDNSTEVKRSEDIPCTPCFSGNN